MVEPALTFEFAVFVNGVEQPGTRFITTFPTGFDSDNQKQLTGVCHINCDDEDSITIRNVSNGFTSLSALSATPGGPVTVASMTIRKAGSVLIFP